MADKVTKINYQISKPEQEKVLKSIIGKTITKIECDWDNGDVNPIKFIFTDNSEMQIYSSELIYLEIKEKES